METTVQLLIHIVVQNSIYIAAETAYTTITSLKI